MSELPILVLQKDLARLIRSGHPWVFADAISVPAGLTTGSAAELRTARGGFLARGLYEADSPIAFRIWTLNNNRRPSNALLRERLKQAGRLRRAVVPFNTDAYRLVNGEGDRLPGLVVDIYANTAVVQLDSAALRPLLPALSEGLRAVRPEIEHVLLREFHEPGEAKAQGGQAAPRLEALWGELPDGPIIVQEHGIRMEADLQQGHKTGLYLDQRENRKRIGELAGGKRVLNLFSYTGGFSLAAALGGASQVVTVDSSEPAIEAARRNFEQNGLNSDDPAYDFVAADVFELLGDSRYRQGFDMVVLDPPSLAPSSRARERALSAYRNLNAGALEAVAPGGFLFTASCSSHVDAEDLRQAITAGAVHAKRRVRIVEQRGAGADHPTLPAFPEGDYLQAFLVWVE
jgi:23S rRNA (cytosine1962-C5)-methyltransferase